MKKNCLTCFNLVAGIPLKNTGNSIFQSKLLYKKALVRCKAGFLINGNDQEKILKNVLAQKKLSHLKIFKTAERCPVFSGDQ